MASPPPTPGAERADTSPTVSISPANIPNPGVPSINTPDSTRPEFSSPEYSIQSDDYDPHLHRVHEKPTSNLDTLIHLVKCCLGTGILAIPQSFSKVGLIMGMLGTAIVGSMLTHCLQLLIKMQYEVCKRQRVPQLTYPECLTLAMQSGPPITKRMARAFGGSVNILLITYQLGVACVYIVFLADNIKQMLDPVVDFSVKIYMLILFLPLISLNLIRDLKVLSPFSLVANIVTFVGLAIIVYYLIGNLKGTSDPAFAFFGSFVEVPLFFGTMLFALTSVPVVVALEREMATPKAYTKPFGVLNIGMTFIITLYAIFGALGYLFCVSQCRDSITLDLPHGTLSVVVQLLMCIAILISYALQSYVPVGVILTMYIHPALDRKNASKEKRVKIEYGVRIGLCLLTLLVAMLVPRLGLIISLFGALCLSALGMIFPPLMEICLLYPNNYGPFKFTLYKDLFLGIFGLVGLLVGTYSAIYAIIKSFL